MGSDEDGLVRFDVLNGLLLEGIEGVGIRLGGGAVGGDGGRVVEGVVAGGDGGERVDGL